MNDDRDIEIYQFSGKNLNVLPDYIWQSLIPLDPQKRRDWLIKQQFRVPVTFDLVALEFFQSYASWLIILIIFRESWEYILKDFRILTVGVLFGLLALYLGFKFLQIKNEETVTEEIYYNFGLSLASVLLAIWSNWFDIFSKYVSW